MTRKTSRAATDVDRHAGEVVRNLRNERNITLAELGQLIGVSHQQLQKYETGTNRMSVGQLHALAKVLGVPVTVFFPGGSGEQTNASRDLALLRQRVRQSVALLSEA